MRCRFCESAASSVAAQSADGGKTVSWVAICADHAAGWNDGGDWEAPVLPMPKRDTPDPADVAIAATGWKTPREIAQPTAPPSLAEAARAVQKFLFQVERDCERHQGVSQYHQARLEAALAAEAERAQRDRLRHEAREQAVRELIEAADDAKTDPYLHTCEAPDRTGCCPLCALTAALARLREVGS